LKEKKPLNYQKLKIGQYMNKIYISWKQVKQIVKQVKKEYEYVLGISRGGIPVATLIGGNVKIIDPYTDVSEFKDKKVLIVDDIWDTGATLQYFQKQLPKADIFYLVKKENKDDWYVFPWETKEDTEGGLEKSCLGILRAVKEDPLREGLLETPKRFAKAWKFWASGYDKDPKEIMKVFSSPGIDQLIIVPKIDFYSHCEHHIAPFYGQVHIGYVPNGKVLGVSKFARLTEIYARRLQIQERLAQQIANDIMKYLKPQGVGVIIRGIHLCMRSRGIEKQNAKMVTSVMLGKFRKNAALRNEFISLIKD